MVFAGHETTATALAFTWYVLATHPDIRERFDAELETVLGDHPQPTTISKTSNSRRTSSPGTSAIPTDSHDPAPDEV